MADSTTTTRKTIRVKKATDDSVVSETQTPIPQNRNKNTDNLGFSFVEIESLIADLNQTKSEIEKLEKEIKESRQAWEKEQKDHETQVKERNDAEELARKREQETYDYETKLLRKKTEDEFSDKKIKQEKELTDKREQIEADKEELESLRKQVAQAPADLEKAVKEATDSSQKDLTKQWEMEKKLREQEFKSQLDLLNLKISNLSMEKERQEKEVIELKKDLESAVTKVKELAVKVIEASGSSSRQTQTPVQT